MNRRSTVLIGTQAALVLGLGLLVRSGAIPLGVPGEWEWQRVRVGPTAWPLAAASLGLIAFAWLAAAGFRSLDRPTVGRRAEAGWLAALVVAAVGVQGVVQEGSPDGYGLSRWIIALHSPGASGYYTVARDQMADTGRFLAEYPSWIARQDALHTGTHPPGLFLASRLVLGFFRANPELARRVVELSPGSVAGAVRIWRDNQGLTRADAAALVATGFLTMLACGLTVLPIYLLARVGLPPGTAWVAACLWPLVPSALMFQPTADAAFPLLSTAALALAAWAGRSGVVSGLILAAASGLVMALGMLFTLAFLPVGVVVALILLATPGPTWGRRLAWTLATGLGFLAGALLWWASTSANPFATWWVNQRNHARFYVEYPRSYLAWALINPVELAVGLGLPAASLAVAGMASARRIPPATWATLGLLVLLTLSGRSLSEVPRLWLPYMPPLLVAAAVGFDWSGGRPRTLGGVVGLTGLQALILEGMIQVVYPV